MEYVYIEEKNKKCDNYSKMVEKKFIENEIKNIKN